MAFSRAWGKVLSWMVSLKGRPGPERIKPQSGPLTTHSHDAEDVQTKLPQNTVVGCRDRAAADLQDAAISTNRNERKRLRLSAKRWTRRGDMLERIVKSFRKRASLDEASRQYRRDRNLNGS